MAPGIVAKILNVDTAQQRVTALVRMEPGSRQLFGHVRKCLGVDFNSVRAAPGIYTFSFLQRLFSRFL